MRLAVILHEHSGRAGNMRPGLARPALVLVILRNRQPGVFIRCRSGLQGRDPGSGRNDVRLDAAVFTGAATGEVRHGFLPFGVNEKIEAVVLRRAAGDDVFGHGRAADGLRARTRVAGGEFQNVLLIAGSLRIGVANQGVKLRRVEVISPLCIVAPTIGADVSAGADGVAR